MIYSLGMKNETNLALIAEIKNNQNVFTRFSLKMCRRQEVAEDVLHNVVLKLLENEITFEVYNNRKFIFTMIFQMSRNYWNKNKRYFQIGDLGLNDPDFDDNAFMDILVQKHQGCTYQEDIEYSFNLKRIRKEANGLPPKQKHAIFQALAGNDVGEELGDVLVTDVPQYESLKTNKRLAIQKLKLKLA